MSFPTGLFIDTPEVEDVSMHQLSEDTESWPEEIISKFRERVPASAGMSSVVKFMKKDDENGTATGSILVSNEKKSAVVPLIIKDFMLYPLDVMQVDGKLVPLTEDYFKGAFSTNELFGKMEEYPTFGGLGRFEDANLWKAIYPPSLGRYAYASGPYPILEEISDTIDGKDFRDYISKNPTHILGFRKHGHADIIKKIANLQPVNMNEFRQGVSNLIDRNIVMLRKESPNKYSILANSDSVFSPVICQCVSREDFYKHVTEICDEVEDVMNEVDQNGEKMLYVPTHDEPMLARPVSEKVVSCDQVDHYQVRTKNGLNVTGLVIPKVIGFNQKIEDLKLFLGETMSTIQPEIAGVRVDNSRFELPFSTPKPGQTGTFVLMPNKSRALATVPVTIVSITQDCGQTVVKAQDLLGVGLKIVLDNFGSQMYKSIIKKGDAYCMPKDFKWVPMEGFERVSNSPADYTAMGMGYTKVAHPVHLIYTGYNQFSIKGVDKYAHATGWDPTCLESWQAKFLLASLGTGEEKIAQVIKQAKVRGVAEVQHARFTPLASEKIAAAVPTARKMYKVAQTLRCNLTKVASFMENSQSVDAMLSLNFVNPDNVSKFVSKIPTFKACVSHLASALIASRLGIREIPEQSVSTAMYRLLDVIEGLEALRATSQVDAG